MRSAQWFSSRARRSLAATAVTTGWRSSACWSASRARSRAFSESVGSALSRPRARRRIHVITATHLPLVRLPWAGKRGEDVAAELRHLQQVFGLVVLKPAGLLRFEVGLPPVVAVGEHVFVGASGDES